MSSNNLRTSDPPKEELSRRSFLQIAAGGGILSMISPASSVVESLKYSNTDFQGNVLTPIIDLPEAVNGEHPIKRMMEDLHRALQKPMDHRKWIMVIDLRKCTGCNGCNIACVTENKLPPGVTYRPVITETMGVYPNVARRFIPRPCMQCEEPPCVPVCPVNATWKRSDGIVVVDYDKCIGCRYCISACPYSARSFDSGFFYGDFEGGERQPYELLPSPEYGDNRVRKDGESPIGNARKCNFCIHRIDRGELPACVLSCMGRATYFGDVNDPNSLVSELIGTPNILKLKDELGANPNVYYLV